MSQIKTIKADDNVACDDLSKLKFVHHDYDGRKNRLGRFIITIIIGLMLAAIIAFFVFNREQLIEVRIAFPQKGDGRLERPVLNASGYVTPRRRSTIASKITGRIIDLNAEEGLIVKKGHVLARLDDADARRQVETMHANLEVIKASTSELRVNLIYASQTLERYKKLFDTKVVSQQQLDESQRSVDTLKAQIASTQKEVIASQARLRSAQQSLKNYTILAPFSGLIVSKNAQIGEMVSPVSAGGGYTRTGIATIVDMESLDIEVDINESNIAQVKVGQNAIAILDAYQGWKIPAKVKTIIPTADRQKATVKVRISFDVKDPKILPDMGVKVTFLDSNEKMGDQNPTIRIPKEALRKDNGGEFVYLYKNGFIERQPILTGEKSGALIEVSGGIRVDDMVVVESEANVKDGQKVQLASD